ncbi:hypothetical protein VM57_10300 [Stenotrophomonas maltophilia]|uniref:Uncharacterized protein n=1 Tax=Stenotrophomonas maltophilia TaxID=40324 RepID=A0A0F5ZQK5_STEMA|nr:hypothetical protein VM57_10300 [Stenotrophomonas maltophilia]
MEQIQAQPGFKCHSGCSAVCRWRQGSGASAGKDGKTTELAEVDLGQYHGDWIEVSGQISAGQRVVVAGAKAIRPGTQSSLST